jgi:hypothetical protein
MQMRRLGHVLGTPDPGQQSAHLAQAGAPQAMRVFVQRALPRKAQPGQRWYPEREEQEPCGVE